MARAVSELVDARREAGVSQDALAALVGWSQSAVSRFERLLRIESLTVVELCRVAAVLGREAAIRLYPVGGPLRDKGHQGLIARLSAILNVAWRVAREVPLPNLGDPRAWDLVLRLAGCIVGVEAETRLRDLQAFVRRIHERERDGGVGPILIVLAESAVNRRVLPELLERWGRSS